MIVWESNEARAERERLATAERDMDAIVQRFEPGMAEEVLLDLCTQLVDLAFDCWSDHSLRRPRPSDSGRLYEEVKETDEEHTKSLVPGLRTRRAASAIAKALHDKPSIIEGDGRLTLEAMKDLMSAGVPLPDWLRSKFDHSVSRVVDAEIGTWDEAFGLAWPKGTHLKVERERWRLANAIRRAAIDLLREDPHRPFNQEFWEELGPMIGIGATKAAGTYRDAVTAGRAPNIESLREMAREKSGDSQVSR